MDVLAYHAVYRDEVGVADERSYSGLDSAEVETLAWKIGNGSADFEDPATLGIVVQDVAENVGIFLRAAAILSKRSSKVIAIL